MIVSDASIQPSTVVRDLGVIVDGDLSLAAHVSHITSVCFFHLRQLRLIRRSLTMDTTHVWVRAIIHSRLDYCNALFAGFPASVLAVCSQSGCSSRTWVTWLCFSYCTDAQLITLAQLSTASDIQTILAHVQVSARASASVPDQPVRSDFCLGSVSASIGR